MRGGADGVAAMAFGESLGIIDDRINQVQARASWPTGNLDQTIFETKDPAVAESIMHIFDVSPPPYSAPSPVP